MRAEDTESKNCCRLECYLQLIGEKLQSISEDKLGKFLPLVVTLHLYMTEMTGFIVLFCDLKKKIKSEFGNF